MIGIHLLWISTAVQRYWRNQAWRHRSQLWNSFGEQNQCSRWVSAAPCSHNLRISNSRSTRAIVINEFGIVGILLLNKKNMRGDGRRRSLRYSERFGLMRFCTFYIIFRLRILLLSLRILPHEFRCGYHDLDTDMTTWNLSFITRPGCNLRRRKFVRNVWRKQVCVWITMVHNPTQSVAQIQLRMHIDIRRNMRHVCQTSIHACAQISAAHLVYITTRHPTMPCLNTSTLRCEWLKSWYKRKCWANK